MKIVAITGAGQGIGRALAWHFAEAGYGVSFIDPDNEAGREVLAGIGARKAQGLFQRGDVAKPKDISGWMARTVKELGVPDVLINNAGIVIRKDVLKLTPAEFQKVINTNLGGAFFASQAAARVMAKRGEGGAIINIASTRAFMSEPDTEGYTASKGGIVALTHGLAISLAPYRIRVNAISPGWIEVSDWKKSSQAVKPKHSRADRAQHPVGRVGTPQDIAEACQFLAEKAGFMTGQNITIDGGMSVKMIYAE
ncbi:NAD(P)-dependent dehydrogenase (short-subunit alcohol dehydrogenase family) [Rhizomicrobium palustre]|uniref:NAD(P)-dependent dehydrogenase (Short-subunit alcohol dehydrogenase family) n=1 Tax=Rhizomicrobium palustre TaxID=189966 RepID=A0A846N178_9PROT|nr:SDR family oxidoreductase [Rhizomicrobium palustre]NIK89333.1 NAD(P)-dependent dehydrogenase (short-subunit alcohol dehydrogenase family) [Rhizomicrobium palustre]